MSNRATRGASLAGVCLVLLVGACEQVTPIEEENGGEGIPAEVQRIFDDSCALAGCHGMGTAQAGLDLGPAESASILDRNSTQDPSLDLVEIGNVDESYLARKILPEAERTGDLMPMPPGELSEEDRAILIGWIAGAPLPGGDTEGTGDTGGTGTTGAMLQACGLEDLEPGAPDPIVSGTGMGEIPPDIAEALARNCGCHYADDLDAPVTDYPSALALDIATWDGFHTELPTGTLAYVRVQEKLNADVAPMPPAECVLEGGESITADDLDLLNAWLDADAPDGASWP